MALVAYSVIDKSPIVFLRLAEKNVGEIDAFLYKPPVVDLKQGGDKSYPDQYYNFTKITELLPEKNFSPRKYLPATIINEDNKDQATEEKKIIFIDTDRERQIGIGRKYPFPKLNRDECIVSSSILKDLGLSVGSKMTFETSADMAFALKENLEMNEILPKFWPQIINCTVVAPLSFTYGKFFDDL